MADGTTVGELIAILRLKGGEEFATKFNNVTSRIRQGVQNLQKDWKGLSIQILGTAYAMDRLVSRYVDFDKKIGEISTLLDHVTEDGVQRLGQEIKDMSVIYGQALDSMAKARYDIISAGFTGAAESAEILAQASKLAVGGVSEVSKTALTLTKMLNAFGYTADRSSEVIDILFTTVQKGQTTIDELVEGLGHVVALAEKAHLGMKGLGAVLAAGTKGGLPTELAVVGLRGALDALIAPMAQAKTAMEQAGIKVRYFDNGMLDMVSTIKQFEGLELDALKKFIPEDRAANLIAVLVKQVDYLQESMEAMNNATGAGEIAFAKMAERASFKVTQMKQKITNSLEEVGASLYPLYNLFGQFLVLLTKIPESIRAIIVSIGGLTVVLGILRKILIALNISMGPAGWLITGAILLGSAFALLGKEAGLSAAELGEFRQEVNKLTVDQAKKQLAELTAEYDIMSKKLNEMLGLRSMMKSVIGLDLFSRQEDEMFAMMDRMKVLRDRIAGMGEESGGSGGGNGKPTQEELDAIQAYNDKKMDLQYQYQEKSLSEYVTYLKKRRDSFAKDSLEFLDIDYKIKGLLKDANDQQLKDQEAHDEKVNAELQRQAEEKKAQLQRQADYAQQMSDMEMDMAFQNNEISFEEYKNYLQAKLDATEQFTQEYLQIWRQIHQLERSEQQQHAAQMTNQWINYVNAIEGALVNVSSSFFTAIKQKGDVFKSVLKSLLIDILDFVQREFFLAKIHALIKSFFTGGVTSLSDLPGLAAAAAGIALAKGYVQSMAEGGVVRRPQLAIVGDRIVRGRNIPEVVAPADKFETFASQLMDRVAGQQTNGAVRGGDIYMSNNFNTPLQDKRMATKLANDVMRPEIIRNGKRLRRYINENPFEK